MVSTIIALTKVVDVESDAVIIISQLFTTSFIFKLLADLLCWCCWWEGLVGGLILKFWQTNVICQTKWRKLFEF